MDGGLLWTLVDIDEPFATKRRRVTDLAMRLDATTTLSFASLADECHHVGEQLLCVLWWNDQFAALGLERNGLTGKTMWVIDLSAQSRGESWQPCHVHSNLDRLTL